MCVWGEWGEEIAPATLMSFLERPDVIGERTGMKLKRTHTVLQVSGRWEWGAGGAGGAPATHMGFPECSDVIEMYGYEWN